MHCARRHAVSPFAVPQSFPDDTVAKNGAALLALHYLEPARQYDRMFPEPYKSLWQALSSKGARMKTNPNAAGASASTSSKPMSARARKKEESKQQAHICEKCGKAFKKAHGLATHDKREHPPPKKVPGQESDDDDDDDSTDEEGAGAGLWGGGGGASTASTAGTSSAPPPPAAAPPLPAAPSVPITLTSQSYFASKFDRRKDALERQKKKSKRKGTNKGLEMANRDPTIMMGDRHRATVESLLEECGFGASYIVIEQALKDHPNDALPLAAMQCVLVGAATLGIASATAGAAPWDLPFGKLLLPKADASSFFEAWAVPATVAYTGIWGTAATIWIEATVLKRLPIVDASVILSTEPLWATGLAALMLGEVIGVNDVIGGAFIIIALLVNEGLLHLPGQGEEERASSSSRLTRQAVCSAAA